MSPAEIFTQHVKDKNIFLLQFCWVIFFSVVIWLKYPVKPYFLKKFVKILLKCQVLSYGKCRGNVSHWSSAHFTLRLIKFNFYHSMGKFSRRQIDIFLIFPRKQGLTFHPKCLLLKMLPRMLRVKVHLSPASTVLDKQGIQINIFHISPWKCMLYIHNSLICHFCGHASQSGFFSKIKWFPITNDHL